MPEIFSMSESFAISATRSIFIWPTANKPCSPRNEVWKPYFDLTCASFCTRLIPGFNFNSSSTWGATLGSFLSKYIIFNIRLTSTFLTVSFRDIRNVSYCVSTWDMELWYAKLDLISAYTLQCKISFENYSIFQIRWNSWNFSLYFLRRECSLSCILQHGQNNPSHLMKIPHGLHRFRPSWYLLIPTGFEFLYLWQIPLQLMIFLIASGLPIHFIWINDRMVIFVIWNSVATLTLCMTIVFFNTWMVPT